MRMFSISWFFRVKENAVAGDFFLPACTVPRMNSRGPDLDAEVEIYLIFCPPPSSIMPLCAVIYHRCARRLMMSDRTEAELSLAQILVSGQRERERR